MNTRVNELLECFDLQPSNGDWSPEFYQRLLKGNHEIYGVNGSGPESTDFVSGYHAACDDHAILLEMLDFMRRENFTLGEVYAVLEEFNHYLNANPFVLKVKESLYVPSGQGAVGESDFSDGTE